MQTTAYQVYAGISITFGCNLSANPRCLTEAYYCGYHLTYCCHLPC